MTDSGNPSDLQFPVSPEPRDFDVTHVVDKDALEFPSMDDDPSHAAAHDPSCNLRARRIRLRFPHRR